MRPSKEDILNAIRRWAVENDGSSPGMQIFCKHTGVKKYDWLGVYWECWGDALVEAGLGRNEFAVAFTDDFLLGKLVETILELGKFPTGTQLRMRSNSISDFPSHSTFERLGKKYEKAQKIIQFCDGRPEYANVVQICKTISQSSVRKMADPLKVDRSDWGYVYLIKSGANWKIGKSNHPGRRESELSIQLPEKAELIHEIQTDDPFGIESYWHKRFAEKRLNGEWFNLSPEDVAAFKRRKSFM
jgi:hypothetical protein